MNEGPTHRRFGSRTSTYSKFKCIPLSLDEEILERVVQLQVKFPLPRSIILRAAIRKGFDKLDEEGMILLPPKKTIKKP